MREIINLNSGWVFTDGGDSVAVDIPHTWNAADGQSGEHGYKRCACLYERALPQITEGRVRLVFDGVNSVCSVKINDKPIGGHKGGYSRFSFDITDLVRENGSLSVTVDNSDNPEVYPSMADFTFWGGIYRDVYIVVTGECRFSAGDFGSDGVYLTPRKEAEGWSVGVKTLIDGAVNGAVVRYALLDAEGAEICTAEKPAASPDARLYCAGARLWNGRKDPYLYTVKAEIILPDGSVSDSLELKTGFREYYIDADKGFFLNGEHIKLHGVCRHQDRENMGNALTEKEHREDVDIILDSGANAIRLAHYQQSGYFYDLCDESGLLIWAEIPVISRFSAKKQKNARQQLAELIKQNYNHPSIFCWGIENEITIGTSANKKLETSLRELEAEAKAIDSTRLTTCAQVSMLPASSPLNDITDILGYNHYYGWYCDSCDGIGRWLDAFKASEPKKKLCLSEYGAEAVLKWQTETPEQGDYTEQYQLLFHERYLEEIEKRDWLWGSFLWNTFDFGSAVRSEGGTRGRNNKGLVTFDRKVKKDAFYLYRAAWSEEDTLHVCSSRFVRRPVGGTTVKVLSNLPEVTLCFNGEERTLSGKRVFNFENIPVLPGENIYTAKAGELEESITVTGVESPEESYVLPASQHSFVRNWFPDGERRDDCLSSDSTVGELLASEDARTIARTQLGDRSNILFGPLTAPLKPIKISSALKLAKKFGLSEDLAGLADGFLQTIKK